MEAGRKVLSWTNTNPQVEQKRFIDAYLAGRENFSSLCRGFGVSRKTGYKRLKLRNGDLRAWATLAAHPNLIPGR